MEVRDPIHGSIEIQPREIEVIDHPLFQRLRSIRQLGFSQLSFPGATHTRLSHGLGTMHLATRAFDGIFAGFAFTMPGARERLRQTVRLAALLHDVGHPPLSHCAEVAMPRLRTLRLACYGPTGQQAERQATHEDVSVLLIAHSSLSPLLRRIGHGIEPLHVAALVSPQVQVDDGFFLDDGRDLRPVLSQIVSSECDVDRMDYLKRDSVFAGVEYGRFDQHWLLSCMTNHVGEDGRVHLALDSRGLYAFDHFLLARYHMFLIVYYHYRSVVFEEMLRLYLESAAGEYLLPVEAEEYGGIDDTQLMARLRQSGNGWARRIVESRPYSLLLERHGPKDAVDLGWAEEALERAGINRISVASRGVLSKYVGKTRALKAPPIYVVDRSGGALAMPARTLDQATDLFRRYGEERQIARIYVAREEREGARAVLERVAAGGGLAEERA
ncbi:MAG: HD domain-containing protein [Deltaproteobacteria bacterium]|nr:HD domain-containing protein [Deltaproteobacteria bacterium]